MPIINPDTSQALDMSPIEPGTYAAKIVDVESKLSQAGNPMIVVKTEVMVDGKVRVRNAFLVITGQGSYAFDQLLRATGFEALADQYKDPEQENPDFDTDNLIGQEVQVVIDQGLDQNKNLRDNIKTWLRA